MVCIGSKGDVDLYFHRTNDDIENEHVRVVPQTPGLMCFTCINVYVKVTTYWATTLPTEAPVCTPPSNVPMYLH